MDCGGNIIFFAIILHQNMDRVGGDCVVQNLYLEPLPGLSISPVSLANEPLAIVGKLQQKFLFVAPVRDVPDVVGDEMPMSSWHGRLPLLSENTL